MSNNFEIKTPAELALPFVDAINTRSEFEFNEEEERLLAQLDYLADLANMHSMYFTQVGKALAIPASYRADEKVPYTKYDYLSFEGRLVTYSVVKIGRILGAMSVRALCLSFDEVTLFPSFNLLSNDKLLHVPALAVHSMSLAPAA